MYAVYSRTACSPRGRLSRRCTRRLGSRIAGEERRKLVGRRERQHRRDVLVGAHHDDDAVARQLALGEDVGAGPCARARRRRPSPSPSAPAARSGAGRARERARCRRPRSAAGRSTFTSNTASMSAPAGVCRGDRRLGRATSTPPIASSADGSPARRRVGEGVHAPPPVGLGVMTQVHDVAVADAHHLDRLEPLADREARRERLVRGIGDDRIDGPYCVMKPEGNSAVAR